MKSVFNGIKNLLKGKNYRIFNWLEEKENLLKMKQGVDATIIDSYLADANFFNSISGSSEIDVYIDGIRDYFPLIELQTNAMLFNPTVGMPYRNAEGKIVCIETDEERQMVQERWREHLIDWEINGLTTVAISIAHYENSRNQEILCDNGGSFRFKYPDLSETIKIIHNEGLSVRLSVVGLKGYIDDVASLKNMIRFAKNNQVEQLTWRPVAIPKFSRSDAVAKRTRELLIDDDKTWHIKADIGKRGNLLLRLPHGAEVYDVDGQNLCLSNCLTRQPDNSENIRQLIYNHGALTYDWEFAGARIL